MEFHAVLSLCRPKNKNRWLYGEPLTKMTDKHVYEESFGIKCSKCGFQTKKGDLMAYHLAPGQLCYGFKALILRNNDEKDSKESNKEWDNIYDEMVDIFGLKRLANIDPVKNEERRNILTKYKQAKSKSGSPFLKSKDKIEKELEDLIPSTKIQSTMENSQLISYLFDKEKKDAISFRNEVENLALK